MHGNVEQAMKLSATYLIVSNVILVCGWPQSNEKLHAGHYTCSGLLLIQVLFLMCDYAIYTTTIGDRCCNKVA